MNKLEMTDDKYIKLEMPVKKRIALVAHDNKKRELFEWIDWNKELLQNHKLFATGTTGRSIIEKFGLEVDCMESGPLGGDLEIGALIANKVIDILIFLWDPLTVQPHDTDVKALLRISAVWNIPVACNRSSADFIISSKLMDQEYNKIIIDYKNYRERKI